MSRNDFSAKAHWVRLKERPIPYLWLFCKALRDMRVIKTLRNTHMSRWTVATVLFHPPQVGAYGLGTIKHDFFGKNFNADSILVY